MLVIPRVRPEDSGKYECRGTGVQTGHVAVTSAQVIVNSKPDNSEYIIIIIYCNATSRKYRYISSSFVYYYYYCSSDNFKPEKNIFFSALLNCYSFIYLSRSGSFNLVY